MQILINEQILPFDDVLVTDDTVKGKELRLLCDTVL
jgi:hypothetical protein